MPISTHWPVCMHISLKTHTLWCLLMNNIKHVYVSIALVWTP